MGFVVLRHMESSQSRDRTCVPCIGTVKKYDAVNTKQIKLKLNKRTDADILEALESVPNKQGYIKSLIRKDIAQNS